MWESLVPLAGALLGGSSSGSSQQTVSKDPWSAAQPWMTSNLGLGQQLMNQYMANPLSSYQQQAYANSANGSNQARSILSQILPQLSGVQGFDRTNPLARPSSISFNAGSTSGASPIAGNLGFSVNPGNAQQMASLQAQIAALQAQQAQAQAAAQPSMFTRGTGNRASAGSDNSTDARGGYGMYGGFRSNNLGGGNDGSGT